MQPRDVTMGELISPESDGDYGGMKDSDLIVFYMGKLEKLDAGRDLLHKQHSLF